MPARGRPTSEKTPYRLSATIRLSAGTGEFHRLSFLVFLKQQHQRQPGGEQEQQYSQLKAVEQLFNVTVEGVQVLNRKGKLKRTIRGFGKRNDIRKAYVKLAEGQDIDFLDVE